MTNAQLHRELKADLAKIGLELKKISRRIELKAEQRKAQKKAANPFIEALVQVAPTERLSNSIDIWEPDSASFIKVGPNRKKGGELAWIFEYGTLDRYTGKGKTFYTTENKNKGIAPHPTGIMPKQAWIKPTFNKTKYIVLATLKNEYEKLINKAIQQSAK